MKCYECDLKGIFREVVRDFSQTWPIRKGSSRDLTFVAHDVPCLECDRCGSRLLDPAGLKQIEKAFRKALVADRIAGKKLLQAMKF